MAEPEPQLTASVLERAAVRVTTAFFLRQVALLADLARGDVLLGIVLIAVIDANTRRLIVDDAHDRRFSGLDDIPPDEERRPVSVRALSVSLKLPYETARRYVGRLLALGLCQRLGRAGVVVPAHALGDPRVVELTRRSFEDVRRFVAALRRVGVDVDAMR
jgi:hypothetical protein